MKALLAAMLLWMAPPEQPGLSPWATAGLVSGAVVTSAALVFAIVWGSTRMSTIDCRCPPPGAPLR